LVMNIIINMNAFFSSPFFIKITIFYIIVLHFSTTFYQKTPLNIPIKNINFGVYSILDKIYRIYLVFILNLVNKAYYGKRAR
jgi:hypothetical protein